MMDELIPTVEREREEREREIQERERDRCTSGRNTHTYEVRYTRYTQMQEKGRE